MPEPQTLNDLVEMVGKNMHWYHNFRNELAAYRELAAAARVIFEVSSKAGIDKQGHPCPHGNYPAYPSHARWCDKCFGRLEDALDAVSDIGKDEG